MKWKIIRRYIAAMMITTLIVINCLWIINLVNAFLFVFNKDETKTYDLYDNTVSQLLFVKSFSKNFKWNGNELIIDDRHLNNLREYGIWLQVLDSNSREVYSCFRPAGFPDHYAPDELVHLYTQSSTIKGSSLFIEPYTTSNTRYSYIMGFPHTISEKRIFTYNPSTFKYDILKLVLLILIVTGVITFLVSYIFSSNLAKPVIMIIDNIKALSSGDYSGKFPAGGIYSEVNRNLSTLADTLALGENERKKNEQLREEWIANITHDLKTPLSSIKGYAELMQEPEYKLSEEEIVRYSAVILDKANYLESLTEDLKLTYQLKSLDAAAHFKELNIVELARDAVIDIMNTPSYENACVSFDAEKEVILFKGDGKLITRALQNLLYNSLVHNPQNTRVQVRITLEAGIKIVIEDNGRGIPEAELNKLFERYFRGTDTGESHKGSGLGLAIAKQVIELHGGCISVSSRINSGTSFIISLP
jgi:signal transduction histidine kinase